MSKLTIPSNFAVQLNAGAEFETVTKDGIVHLLVPYFPESSVTAAAPSKSAAKEEAPAEATGKRGRRSAAPAEPAEEKPTTGRRAVRGGGSAPDFKAKALEIFTKVENGDVEEEAGRKELKALSSDKGIKANLDKVFDEFMNNGDAALEDIAGYAADALAGKPIDFAAGEEEDADPDAPEGEKTDVKDLQEGDYVSVFFKDSDDYEAGWFTGEVSKVAKGRGGKAKVTILFDPAEGEKDGDEMDYDAELMGDVYLLPAE